jgi:hypothetical protein
MPRVIHFEIPADNAERAISSIQTFSVGTFRNGVRKTIGLLILVKRISLGSWER